MQNMSHNQGSGNVTNTNEINAQLAALFDKLVLVSRHEACPSFFSGNAHEIGTSGATSPHHQQAVDATLLERASIAGADVCLGDTGWYCVEYGMAGRQDHGARDQYGSFAL